MEISVTTPALLFPAISLLLLAYTNRFLTIANLIRTLYSQHKVNPDSVLIYQIKNLRNRMYLIRNMQLFGISSLFLSVVCMFFLFSGWIFYGELVLGLSLILLMISLVFTIREIQISNDALEILLADMEHYEK